MLRNYATVALRYLIKHRGYTVINVTGLAIGIACVLLIFLYVRDEFSYDRFHEQAERIYRVTTDVRIGNAAFLVPLTAAPVSEALVETLPEVQWAVRIYGFAERKTTVAYEGHSHLEAGFVFADSTVFDVFTFDFVRGNPATALVEPYTVVLTETTARRYFGTKSPVGNVLVVEGTTAYRVTGVIEDVPANAHFHFDFLASLASLEDSRATSWNNALDFITYILLREEADPQALETKMESLSKARMEAEQGESFSYETWSNAGNRWELGLQPLLDLHLHSDLAYEIEPGGDVAYVYLFSVIALLILLIACINFTNLATAQAAKRMKEIGIRKAVGAHRLQLAWQFLGEAILLSVLALLLALGLVELLLPLVKALTGISIGLHYASDAFVLPALLGLALITGLLAGSYPAFFLGSLRPIAVLKGHAPRDYGGRGLRNVLVVFQFAASIALIASTLVVYRQLVYVQHADLGFEKEQVIVLNLTEGLGRQQSPFKQELLKNSVIQRVAMAGALPGKAFGASVYIPEGGTPEDRYVLLDLPADSDLAETLGLRLKSGRYFSAAALDSSSVLLNEAAVRKIGWDDPLGKQLMINGGSTFIVIGIVEDFHTQSLHQEIHPLILRLGDEANYAVIRVRPDDLSGTLAFIQETWETFVPGQPFAYSFLDQDFDTLYQADQRTGQLFGGFALLAIFIACLGLFGLAALAAEQHTKEIGIRKALGASVPNIIALLSRGFVLLLGIAFVLGACVAYFGMRRWLEGFAFRIDLSWDIFLLAGLLALVVAVLTVSYQALRAALADPVKSLRYE